MKIHHLPTTVLKAITAALLLLTAGVASAVNVNPGETKTLGGDSPATNPALAGSVIRDSLHSFTIRDTANNVLVSGNLQERVVRNSLGRLIFHHRLRDLSAPGTARIVGVDRTGFRRANTDINWSTTGSGDVGPESVTRSADGDLLSFSHNLNTIDPPAQEGRFTFALTEAPDYDLSGSITIYARTSPITPVYRAIIENVSAPGVLDVNSGQSIQYAIDHADAGDTVNVAAGTYVENITLRSDVNVAGAGAGETILEGTGTGSVVIADAVTNSEFTGFTVQGSGTGSSDAGIRIFGGSPLIKGNTVQNNSDGIALTSGSTAIICGNTVQDNRNDNNIVDWGIIVLGGSTPLITNNLVLRNEVGIYLFTQSTSGTQIVNNTVANNDSQGIWLNDANPTVKNNISTGNTTGISASFGAMPVLSYNDFWGNSWQNYDVQSGGVATPGIGSISADPLFGSGWELLEGSPCIDAGDPASIYDDLDGSRNDIGATGGPCSVAAPQGTVTVGYLWTSVGNIPVSEIEQNPGSSKAGLTLDRDRPFGGTPWLYGPFGVLETGVRYYAVQIGQWSGNNPPSYPADFTYVDTPLSKVRYTVSGGMIVASNTAVGPFNIGSSPPIYTNTINSTAGYWAHENLRLKLNSIGLANGRYDFRMEGYDGFGNPVVLSGLKPTLTLEVNNTRPLVRIDAVSYNNGPPIDECSIIRLPNSTSTLNFVYTAEHADGFLDDYVVEALVGRNRSAGYIASDNYGNHVAADGIWNGENMTPVAATPVVGPPWPALQPWETCAYQFRVRAWARTTNGFHRIYWTTFFDNYAIDLNSTVICTPDLDGDGDVDADDLAIMAAAYGTAQQQ